jgi:hypothetical protein
MGGDDLVLGLAVVEMEATDVCVYESQRCLALQRLRACFERLGLARSEGN